MTDKVLKRPLLFSWLLLGHECSQQMVTAIGGSEGDGGGWDGQGNQDDNHPLSIVYRKKSVKQPSVFAS